MKNKIKIIGLILLVLMLSVTLYTTMINSPCEGVDRLADVMFMILIGGMGLLFYLIALILKFIKADVPYFWSAIICIAFFIFFIMKLIDKDKNEIKNNGGKLVPAKIYSLSNTAKGGSSVLVQYKVIDNFLYTSVYCNRANYDKLSVGDTVLIIHSLYCYSNTIDYKLFPSRIEINRALNGCLYINGELVDEN